MKIIHYLISLLQVVVIQPPLALIFWFIKPLLRKWHNGLYHIEVRFKKGKHLPNLWAIVQVLAIFSFQKKVSFNVFFSPETIAAQKDLDINKIVGYKSLAKKEHLSDGNKKYIVSKSENIIGFKALRGWTDKVDTVLYQRIPGEKSFRQTTLNHYFLSQMDLYYYCNNKEKLLKETSETSGLETANNTENNLVVAIPHHGGNTTPTQDYTMDLLIWL